MNSPTICRVALAIPLHKQFDYVLPDYLLKITAEDLVGCRVRVPFGGKRQMIGVICEVNPLCDYAIEKLKKITQLIDSSPLLNKSLWSLLHWSAFYYQHPFGDIFQQAIPTHLRQGKEAIFKGEEYWQLAISEINVNDLKNAKKQQQVISLLQTSKLSYQQLKQQGVTRPTLNALKEKKLIRSVELQPECDVNWVNRFTETAQKPTLTAEQAIAITSVTQCADRYSCYLLEGITGSGKTEVYLNILKPILASGKQALVIVPEIGLTPQTVERFKARFNVPIHIKHSGLNARQQLDTWLHAQRGSAAIIIGTRSAVFSDCQNLGIIIIDEEHDASFKQQEGFRYHARDFAIKRAHKENIPIVLGSATPSLETLHNALQGKYKHLYLTQRAGKAKPPSSSLINLAGLHLKSGLSPQLIELMHQHLARNNQVILFLNRRGYAPVLMCHECGWLVKCQRCDAFYTYHKSANYLHCHHCSSTLPVPHQCDDCGSTQLIATGVGTEQLEETLKLEFPDYPTVRIDRDNTRKKESFNQYLNDINSGKYKILLGTQMLAKGHHFSDVTLVALIDVDGALFSNDFRASERLAQLFTQVAGRAGREEKKGQVVLQTHHPEHSLLQDLINNGYQEFSRNALKERVIAQLPPSTFQALLRAEASVPTLAENFLGLCRQIFSQITMNNGTNDQVLILGPIPANMERRAGKYRFQLLLQSQKRAFITQTLQQGLIKCEQLPEGRKLKWSIDVDPIDFT